MGEMIHSYKILTRTVERKRQSGTLVCTRFTGSAQGSVAVCCKHDNEPSGSIKDGAFIDRLFDCTSTGRILFHNVS
jgi:hypothetical protein